MLKLIEENDIHIETKVCPHISIPYETGLTYTWMCGSSNQTYPFNQVNEMIADALSGKYNGRLVLKP